MKPQHLPHLILTILLTTTLSNILPAQCTMVIGYSQVGYTNTGWFNAGTGATSNFENKVGDDEWQLLWNGGAGVDKWKDPNYPGWNNAIQSTCTQNSTTPDRVLLSVSGPYGDTISKWVTDIRATVTTIRSKYPTVGDIVLQPVVGGPGHQTCFKGADSVRASWQHKHIDQAINIVANTDNTVFKGCSPEVRTCSDYIDAKGHFTIQGARAAGNRIGNCVRNRFPSKRGPETRTFTLIQSITRQTITIQTQTTEAYELKVYDQFGKLHHKSQNTKTLPTNHLPTGIYVIQIQTKAPTNPKITTQKLLIRH